MVPPALRYTKSHEWAKLDQGVCTVGISQFAVDLLTDVTHVEMPAVGRKVTAGQPFGEVESVKAVSDLYAPVDGEIIETNPVLVENAALIGEDPYGRGWLVKIKVKDGATLEHLLSPETYEKQIASEGH
jgi:glycine cleavage system H protein